MASVLLKDANHPYILHTYFPVSNLKKRATLIYNEHSHAKERSMVVFLSAVASDAQALCFAEIFLFAVPNF